MTAFGTANHIRCVDGHSRRLKPGVANMDMDQLPGIRARRLHPMLSVGECPLYTGIDSLHDSDKSTSLANAREPYTC